MHLSLGFDVVVVVVDVVSGVFVDADANVGSGVGRKCSCVLNDPRNLGDNVAC